MEQTQQSTWTIDPDNFWKRLKGLYSYWKRCKTGVWGFCHVLTIAVPQVSDTKSSAFSIWLLGHEVQGMVMIFAEKNIYFLCPEDKASLLETLKDSVRGAVGTELNIHVKVVNHGGAALMDEVLDALQVCCTHERQVVGYNAAEVPKVGYFGTWTEKLKMKFKLCDITYGLSELFFIKDGSELANMKAASSLASSVIECFVVPEIVHMLESEVAPHSTLTNDMVGFIYDQAEHVGLERGNVGICGGQLVFQSGCGFGLDDLRLPMDNFDLECFKTGVIICSIGLRYKGYCSNISRTILIHPHAKQLKALRVLFKAQKAAISALRPGNKVSAAYQAAVTVVEKEAPEFAPHLTKSAGSGIGLEFCESRLSLDASNEQVLEVGMVFNVSLGFENLQAETGNPLTERSSMLIADTVVINEASTKALTDFAHPPCLIGAEDDECLKVINRRYYDSVNPKGITHYIDSFNLWDFGVDSKNGDNVARSIRVDEKMEAVFLPLFNSVVPFHISSIERVIADYGEEHNDFYLYVFFNTDANTVQSWSKRPTYLQQLEFYLKGPGGVRDLGYRIKALQQKYMH